MGNARITIASDFGGISKDIDEYRASIIGKQTLLHRPDIPVTGAFVAPKQGEIRRTNDGWTYRDLSGKNQTLVNGTPLPAGGGIYLLENDEIVFSPTGRADDPQAIRLVFHGEAAPATPAVDAVQGTTVPTAAVPASTTSAVDAVQGTTVPCADVSTPAANVSVGAAGMSDAVQGTAAPTAAAPASATPVVDAVQGTTVPTATAPAPAVPVSVGAAGMSDAVQGTAAPTAAAPASATPKVDAVQGTTVPTATAPAPAAAAPAPAAAASAPAQDGTRGVFSIEIIDRKARLTTPPYREITLLKDIRLQLHDGEMVGVLGGSGVGKTTFMNAVTGKEKANARIIYNGTDLYADEEARKACIKLVPQDDQLRESDTVFHTLDDTLTSDRRSRETETGRDPQKRRERVTEVLRLFGLEQEARKQVSKLSGGQYKRLGIAMRYIVSPQVFFLDEPDSGLDTPLAIGIFELLRVVADQGKIVMFTTHSANRAAQLFDKVIVLRKDEKENCGRLAFFGTVPEAYDFFGTDSLERISG